jgi:hypothetical protein
MKAVQRRISILLACVLVLQPVSGRAFDDKPAGWLQSKILGRRPQPPETSVQKLARAMDWLEEELLEDGSVVAKAPDVWGEARLTTHRAEFEKELAKRVTGFEVRINASMERSDQAFLASALALSAVAATPPGGTAPEAPNFTQVNQMLPGIAPGDPTADEPTQSMPGTMNVFNTAPGKLLPGSDRFGDGYDKVQLEQTIELDQLSRYLNHLHELRRLNEGDDTADAPGYSLNLVRIPISILPGSKTRRGHSAEITVTAEPVVTEELLPTTFRALVINDLVDQLTVAVVGRLEVESRREAAIQDLYGSAKQLMLAIDIDSILKDGDLSSSTETLQWFSYDKFKRVINEILANHSDSEIKLGITEIQEVIRLVLDGASVEESSLVRRLMATLLPITDEISNSFEVEFAAFAKALKPQTNDIKEMMGHYKTLNATAVMHSYQILRNNEAAVSKFIPQDILQSPAVSGLLQAANNLAAVVSSPPTSGHRRARSPLSGENLQAILSSDTSCLAELIAKHIPSDDTNRVSAVRNILRDELENAYETVFDRQNFSNFTSSDLTAFERWISTGTNLQNASYRFKQKRDSWQINGELRKLLCWPVLVESLLLNRQLNADIRHVSQDPECQCFIMESEPAFYGLDPDATARMAFVQYVKCRWPIHVFALDPVAQEQNITDQYAMRRELQLAMALALSSGRISAQTATRFARRLEMDMETVALNRTAVAFGHGRDTFGWRFFPRVQTPEFESNGKVAFRDLLLGGPNRDELKKQWQLEPGMRECFAVVLMPSFITHVRFDSRGHFSPLVCNQLGASTPADARSSMADTVELSHMIREMQNYAVCARNESHLYRDGEVDRLMKRVDQLSSRLPLQTNYSRVPNENTLGGFEMFSSGVTDLAPELYDWFGEPGVTPGKATRVFLIGSNFSVTGTRVIAGNELAEHTLLSREVMEIVIPASAQSSDDEIDIHVATPYGVSQHLHIPLKKAPEVPEQPPVAAPRLSWEATSQKIIYRWKEATINNEKSWTVENEGVLVFEPHEIAVLLPNEFRSRVPIPADATLNLAIYQPTTDDGNAALLANSAAALKYAPDRHAFILEGATWLSLHSELRTKLIGRLKALGHIAKPPEGLQTLQIVGFITPTGSVNPRVEIDGSIQLQAQFRPAVTAAAAAPAAASMP